MKRTCKLGFAVVATILAACSGGGATDSTGNGSGSGPGPGTDNTCGDGGVICVLGNTFSPVNITISKNGSVTFTPKTAVSHNIVFDAPNALGVTDVGAFSGASVSRTFTETGTFPYHCTLHNGMNGTIKVQ
ncbi:MAG: plastocyanin/azurin family copper-binding protein [Gemmatimonadaceae bacterium]